MLVLMTDLFKHTLNNQDIINKVIYNEYSLTFLQWTNVLWTLKDSPDVNVKDIVYKLFYWHCMAENTDLVKVTTKLFVIIRQEACYIMSS